MKQPEDKLTLELPGMKDDLRDDQRGWVATHPEYRAAINIDLEKWFVYEDRGDGFKLILDRGGYASWPIAVDAAMMYDKDKGA